MRYDTAGELVMPAGFTVDDIGQQVPVAPLSRTVHLNEFTVGATEFYEAGRQGLKPDREYQLRTVDYNGESVLKVDGQSYNIIRTTRRGEWTRLVCERVGGNE